MPWEPQALYKHDLLGLACLNCISHRKSIVAKVNFTELSPSVLLTTCSRYISTLSAYQYLFLTLSLHFKALVLHQDVTRCSVYLITGFGICSTFWDKIFGTEIVLRKLGRALKW
jgi:hypothetical protein